MCIYSNHDEKNYIFEKYFQLASLSIHYIYISLKTVYIYIYIYIYIHTHTHTHTCTHLYWLLITAFSTIFTRKLSTEHLVGFESGTFQLSMQHLNPLGHTPLYLSTLFISALIHSPQKNNLNILYTSIKRQQILVNFTYFPKFISDFLMFSGDL